MRVVVELLQQVDVGVDREHVAQHVDAAEVPLGMHAAHPLGDARVVQKVPRARGGPLRHAGTLRREQLLGPRLLRPARQRRDRRDAQPDLRVVRSRHRGGDRRDVCGGGAGGRGARRRRLARRLRVEARPVLRRVQPPPLVVEGGRQHRLHVGARRAPPTRAGPPRLACSRRVRPSSSEVGGRGGRRPRVGVEVLVRLRQPPRAVGGVLRAALERLEVVVDVAVGPVIVKSAV